MDEFILQKLADLSSERSQYYNTPGIIKYPFWRMTAQNPKATDICINYGEAVCRKKSGNRRFVLMEILERCWCSFVNERVGHGGWIDSENSRYMYSPTK